MNFMKILLLSASLFLASSTSAQISETVNFRTYAVELRETDSLLQATNRATPIRQDGKVFHGLTTWNIRWHFWWDRAADGRCRLSRNSTEFSAEITLPELATDGSAARREFSAYVAKLRIHELGHVQISRRAAQRIDAGIAALPSMSSCPELEKTANELGYRLLDQAKQEERRYDEETGHGRTQGAWLPR